MLNISIRKFLSFYKSVLWYIFLINSSINAWIFRDFVSIFIFEECFNFIYFFINVSCVPFFVNFSFHICISWNILFIYFSIYFRFYFFVIFVNSNRFTIFINKLCDWKNSWSVRFFNYCSIFVEHLNFNTFSYTYKSFLWSKHDFSIY